MGRLLSEKIAKIIVYDKARGKGGNNHDYPGQCWVPKLVLDTIDVIINMLIVFIISFAIIITIIIIFLNVISILLRY